MITPRPLNMWIRTSRNYSTEERHLSNVTAILKPQNMLQAMLRGGTIAVSQGQRRVPGSGPTDTTTTTISEILNTCYS